MKIFNMMLLILALSFVSCSSKKDKNEDVDEMAKTEEVSDELLDEDLDGSEVVIDDADEGLLLDDDEGSSNVADVDEQSDDLIADAEPMDEGMGSGNSKVAVDTSESRSYVVQSGDTLMLVAWKIYGDYSKWRSISRLNGGIVNLKKGMTISYNPPAQEFSWNPEGNPYLIVKGDTLGLISGKVYNTQSKWRKIWNNNRPLIKDPNLIFAGFTLYYIPEDGSVASN